MGDPYTKVANCLYARLQSRSQSKPLLRPTLLPSGRRLVAKPANEDLEKVSCLVALSFIFYPECQIRTHESTLFSVHHSVTLKERTCMNML
jgi:hypothetical protein